MAIFNPETPVGNPNFLEYSRGSMPDRSAGMRLEGKGDVLRAKGQLATGKGNILEGAGKLLEMGVELGDRYTKANIEKDVYALNDENNDFWGVNSAMDIADAETPRGLPSKGPLPDALTEREEHLGLLKGAFESGRISASHFYGRLAMAVKELRQKYPGYREEIDGMVSQVTGMNPANALRNQLLQDWESAASANKDAQGKQWTWIHNNIDDMSATTYDRVMSGEMPFEAAVREVQARKRSRADTADATAQLGLAAAQGTATKRDAVSVGVRGVARIIDQTISDTVTMAAPDSQSLFALIKASEPGGYDEAETAAITQSLSAYQQGLYAEVHKFLDAPINSEGHSLRSVMEGDTTEIMKMVDDRFKVIADAVTNQHFGVLASNQARIEAATNSDVIRGMENRHLRAAMALNKMGMGEWVNTHFMQRPEVLTSVDQAVLDMHVMETVTGDDSKSMSGFVEEAIESGVSRDGILADINQHIGIIMDPKTPLVGAETAAKKFFSPENNGFLAPFKKEHQIRLFNELVSPKMTARMQELGKTNPELWNQYQGWVMDKADAFVKPIAPELQRISEITKGMVSYDYDSETGEIEVVAASGAQSLAAKQDPSHIAMQTTIAAGFAENINKYLRSMNPVLDAGGKDKQKIVIDLFNSYGVRLKPVADGEGEPSKGGDSAEVSGDIQLASHEQAISLLRNFEGFSQTAYYDVNADRIGYGSDTITDSEGNVRKVQPGDKVSKEDAERDLQRRVPEFQQVAIRQVGADNWNELSENAKAAITSIAYNYGEVPKRLRSAVIDGDPQVIAQAIESLENDNGGINKTRRRREAQYVLASR